MDASPDLMKALEPGQFSADAERPFPRRRLGRGLLALLIVLRIYVAAAVPIVGYAFFHALIISHG